MCTCAHMNAQWCTTQYTFIQRHTVHIQHSTDAHLYACHAHMHTQQYSTVHKCICQTHWHTEHRSYISHRAYIHWHKYAHIYMHIHCMYVHPTCIHVYTHSKHLYNCTRECLYTHSIIQAHTKFLACVPLRSCAKTSVSGVQWEPLRVVGIKRRVGGAHWQGAGTEGQDGPCKEAASHAFQNPFCPNGH